MVYKLLDKNILEGKEYQIRNLIRELTPDESEAYYESKFQALSTFVDDGTAIIFVALDEDKIVGYIWGYVRAVDGTSRIHVTQFIVADEYRGRGIGKQLLLSLKKWAMQAGYREIELNVLSHNLGGISFYQREGFVSKSMLMISRIDEE